MTKMLDLQSLKIMIAMIEVDAAAQTKSAQTRLRKSLLGLSKECSKLRKESLTQRTPSVKRTTKAAAVEAQLPVEETIPDPPVLVRQNAVVAEDELDATPAKKRRVRKPLAEPPVEQFAGNAAPVKRSRAAKTAA